MDPLQTTFYTVGIIFMVLYGLLLVGIIVLLFYMWRKISAFLDTVTDKLDSIKYVASHPEEVATSVGEALADTALDQIKKIFTKK